jgi:hypothetical protein
LDTFVEGLTGLSGGINSRQFSSCTATLRSFPHNSSGFGKGSCYMHRGKEYGQGALAGKSACGAFPMAYIENGERKALAFAAP